MGNDVRFRGQSGERQWLKKHEAKSWFILKKFFIKENYIIEGTIEIIFSRKDGVLNFWKKMCERA